MITAACAVVNGGRLMKPYLVEAIEDSDGTCSGRRARRWRRRPFRETSATMRRLLYGVVENGGGKNAKTTAMPSAARRNGADLQERKNRIEPAHRLVVGFAPAEARRSRCW
ncbi:MAG: penicillin-binding transpeptidase domain-containing protein [Christensenellales bacterium]